MNYRIVGGDGKVYGPVPLAQLQRWLAEGRADNRTPVHVEGAANWTYLGLLPELGASFAAPPPARPATPPAPRTNGFAVAGLVCGLLSWTCCCCLPFNVLGVIFSLTALVQLASQPQPREGRGLAIAGLALSAANLLFSLAAAALQLVLHPGAIQWHIG